MVVGMYFVDHPQDTLIPVFIAEATRVVRNGGLIIVSNNPPGWYGGALDHVIKSTYRGAEDRHRIYTEAGFDYHDVYTETDYGTVENMVSAYGFIFGMNAINHIREHKITTNRASSRRHFKAIHK